MRVFQPIASAAVTSPMHYLVSNRSKWRLSSALKKLFFYPEPRSEPSHRAARSDGRLLFADHHQSRAAFAFFPSVQGGGRADYERRWRGLGGEGGCGAWRLRYL
jgi:hypothetical protein